MKKLYLQTYDEGKKKDITCGYLVDNTIYHRRVSNKHFMVKYNGYGIQQDILTKLVKMGVRSIVITTKGDKTSHHSEVKDWVHKGKTDDFGHGKQVFLDIKYMVVEKLM